MIIYLHGPDSYRRQKKLQALLSEYKKKYPDLDLLSVDLEDKPEDWEEIRDFLNQPSIFVDSKIAVVKNPGEVKVKEWIKTIKSFLKDEKTFLILSEEKKPLKDFHFLLEPPVRAQEFKVLEGRLLEVFVREEMKARGVVFAPDALRFFLGFLESEEERSWVAVAELDKLSLLENKKPLLRSELESYINYSLKFEVFRVTREMLSTKNWKERISLLERLLLQREAGAYVFNSLAYGARGGELIALADYDVAVKSGRMEYEEALLRFALLGARA